MPFLIDSQEADSEAKQAANATLIKAAEGVEKLTAGVEGETFSFDTKVWGEKNGPDLHLRGERKRLDDFLQSWLDGKLVRQLSYVDFLIVEWDEAALIKATPYHLRADMHKKIHNGKKHLVSLIMQPGGPKVFRVNNQSETVLVLKHLARKLDEGFDIPPTIAKIQGETARMRVYQALPGVNPNRKLKDGRRLHEALDDFVDWEGICHALGVNEWPSKGIGLGPGRAKKVVDSLLRPRGVRVVKREGTALTQNR